MKIIVLSDSHGCKNLLNLAVNHFKNIKIDYLFHLGDYYSDVDHLIHDYQVVRVPGTWTPFYRNSDIENRIFFDILGWKFFLTHTPDPHFNDLPGDIDPLSLDSSHCHVLLHGHTHIPKISMQNSLVFMNPGHLYEHDNRGYRPTYGYIELTQESILLRVYYLFDQSILFDKQYSKSEF